MTKITEERFSFLVDSLKSDDWYIRRDAAFVLGGTSDMRAFRVLLEALEIETERKVYGHIMVALGRFGEPGLKALLDVAKSAKGEFAAKVNEVLELIPIAFTGRRDQIKSFLDSEDAEVRDWAAKAIAEWEMK